MQGDRQNHTKSPCRPVTHLLSHQDVFRVSKFIGDGAGLNRAGAGR